MEWTSLKGDDDRRDAPIDHHETGGSKDGPVAGQLAALSRADARSLSAPRIAGAIPARALATVAALFTALYEEDARLSRADDPLSPPRGREHEDAPPTSEQQSEKRSE